jgi:hypothetical protein
LNAEFETDGLKVTPRQITEYASTRSWGAKRKALAQKGELRSHEIVASISAAVAERRTGLLVKHQDFLDTSAQVGGEVLQKAQRMIERSNSPRDLASAANAASRGIEIFRRATGLDEPGAAGAAPSSANYYFNFARSPESPFYRPPADAAIAADPDTVSRPQSDSPPGPGETQAILIPHPVGV